ncbi:hypothetical protein CASFOL_035933 [Castilleja foliolosa]|uniref:RNase H type-1 domain-containing protein n=1 Tax=Castilleja foliolosa TaxID=1961234 RepID=A0ABD3BU42_9LAMI
MAQANQKRSSPNQIWIPPPDGWLKINTDAAFADGLSTSGIIFKNKSGTIVLAATFTHNCPDATTAECLALLDACTIANYLKIKKAAFFNDCLNAVTFIKNSPINCFWAANPVVEKIKKCWSNWPHWVFKFSGRSTNSAAHSLAQWGVSSSVTGLIPLDTLPLVVFCDRGFPIFDLSVFCDVNSSIINNL